MERQRARIVPLARGRVLELGMGAGHNLPLYDPAAVSEVVGVDPCEYGCTRVRAHQQTLPFAVDYLCTSAERLPFEAASFDTVLVTFSLCTIPNPAAALEEARRVLKPEGILLFCEHGLSPDPQIQHWQHRINPVWSALAGGCQLNRDILGLLRMAGFEVESTDAMYLAGAPRIAGYNSWGCARVIP